MEPKKLNPSRSDALLVSAVTAAGFLCYILLDLWNGTLSQDYPIFLPLLLLSATFALHGLRHRSYYSFLPDGIYLYQRPNTLLTKLLWKDVKACSVMSPNRRSNYPYYLVLIMKEDAMVFGQPAITCSGKISERKVRQYLLHQLTEELARNQITIEQFRQQDVYFVSVTREQLNQIKALYFSEK